jgi:translocation and assembly module TamB
MFRDNDFEIKKGIIDFLNPYKIEPTVDIASETEVREWMINMDISGTPDDLTFTLSSTPKEEHEDILSLLIFGKTAKEFREGDGGGSFSTTKMLTNLAAEMFSDQVQNATGLDTLEVEYSDKDDEEGINVTLGKDLTRRMAIKYSVETQNSELTQRVTTEYKFLETLLFNAYQDTKGNYGGELQFKLEFR